MQYPQLRKSTIFKTQEIIDLGNAIRSTSTDLDELAAMTKNMSLEQALAVLATKELSEEDKKLILLENGLTVAEKGKTTATKTSTLSLSAYTAGIKANTKAWIANMIANPLTWILAIGAALYGAVKAIDYYNNALQRQKEKLEEVRQSFDDANSNVESINRELETTKKRMEELQAIGNLSFVEAAELDKLKETVGQLEIAADIADKVAKQEAKNLSQENEKTYYKEYGKYNNTSDSVKDIYATGSQGIVNQLADGNLSAILASLLLAKEQLNDAEQNYAQAINDGNFELADSFKIAKEEAEQQVRDIENSISVSLNTLGNYQKNAISAGDTESDYYKSIISDMKLIYEYTDPAKWNTSQVKDILNTDGIEKTKKELIALAKSGELKPETILKYSNLTKTISESNLIVKEGEDAISKFVEQIYSMVEATYSIPNKTDILSISSTVDQLNKQLKPAMESLASVWKDIFTEDGMALDDINILSVADTIKSKLDELEKIDGITVDYSSFEDFIRILEDTSSTEEDVKNGFDKLAQSIVLAGVSGVEDFETLKTALGDLGVVNDEIVAFEALTRNTGALKTAGLDLANATDEQIRKFAEETVAVENVEQAYNILAFRKEALSLNKMSTLQEITNLKNLAINAGYTGEVIEQLTEIELLYQKIASGVLGTNNQQVAMAMDEIYKREKNLKEAVAKYSISPEVDMTNVNKGNSSAAKKTAETIDWIETLLSRIQRTITNLGKTVSATYKNWSKRNNALAQEMKEINKEISAQSTAYDTYMAKANSVSLSEEYKALVRNGGFSFSEIKDEALKKNIDLYRQWYEKALKCSDAIEDLRSNLADLAKTKFDNVAKQYDNQMLMIDHNIQMLQGFVEQSETAGHMASEVYYQAMAEKQQENINGLQAKYTSLLSAFDDAVKNGSIEKYSEEWYNMLGDINDVEKALQSANTQLIEFNQTLQQLSWSVFDRIRDSVSNINTEANFLIDLISRSDLFTESGQMTNEGLAVQGLRAVNYNTYMEQALAYAEEIKRINEEIATDPYDLELIDRKNELIKAQQEAIANANSEKDAIQSLIKDGYDKMLESLNELISKRKELLNSQKDLYDYQNSISEQTSNIASLKKQLQAYSTDNSEQAKSTIQRLQNSLTKAEQSLAESEYERYIQDMEQLYDDLASDTEEWVTQKLDDIDGLIIKAVDATNKNAETISDTINSAADSYSVKLSDKMTAIWDSQENAIDGVNTVVSIYGDIAHDDITSVGSNIANAINGGNTNVTSAISKIQVSMEQMISSLNTIASTNKNSIANSQNNVVNNQPNNAPSNSGNTSSGNGGGSTNGGNTGSKTNGYKGYIGNELIITAPTKPMVELELKKAIERRAEKAAMDEYNRAIKAGYSPQDAGRSAENAKIGYGAQLTALKKIVAYASGTSNAKRGIGLVGEAGNEIIYDKNGRAVLTLVPQLYDFKGGEQVINGNDTKKLLNNVPTNIANAFSKAGNNITTNVDNIEIIVKADNAEEFVASLKSALKNDPQCRKLVQCITIDELAGKGGLRRNNF